MKVYYEVLPTTLGRAMYRINAGLKRYAPDWVQFVYNPESADLQIQDCIGAGSLPFIKNKNYVLLQECLMTEIAPPDWLPYFQESKLVVSYLNIPKIIGSSDFNFIRIPCGVDPLIFYPMDWQDRSFEFLTTGYVAETESIHEVYNACSQCNKYLVHIGHNFNYGQYFNHHENISDSQMNLFYNSSKYTSGLRKWEGFELSILEGLLAGSRGVSFNEEHYSYWFGDLVEYINDGSSEYITEQLVNLINGQYRIVTKDEQYFVKNTFSWEIIAKDFWKGVRDAI